MQTPNKSPAEEDSFLDPVEKEQESTQFLLHIQGIQETGAKSRVETQIRFTIHLTDHQGRPVQYWNHLRCNISKIEESRKLKKSNTNISSIDPQHILHLDADLVKSSDPTRALEPCLSCIQREQRYALKRKIRRRQRSRIAHVTIPGPIKDTSFDMLTAASSLVYVTGSNAKVPESLHLPNMFVFHCNPLLHFSGSASITSRITCYCRHHNELVGFRIRLKLCNSAGQLVATTLSPPIMITDDHKSKDNKNQKTQNVAVSSKVDLLSELLTATQSMEMFNPGPLPISE